MEKAKEHVSKIHDLKEDLMECLQEQFNHGMTSVNTAEAGAVTDMIKDLAEAEEKCWKACYYKSIVHAMHEESEIMDGMDFSGEDGEIEGYRRGSHHRRGYDHWRYASGRFAPSGHGHYSRGYTHPMMPETVDPYMMEQPWGYDSPHHDGSHMASHVDGDHAATGGGSRMGYPVSMRGHHYDNYHKARMGYQQSHDAKSKEHMDESAKKYLVDTVEGIREVWSDADPAMRKEIKNKFAALMSEMG